MWSKIINKTFLRYKGGIVMTALFMVFSLLVISGGMACTRLA